MGKVFSIDGGTAAWAQIGLPVVRREKGGSFIGATGAFGRGDWYLWGRCWGRVASGVFGRAAVCGGRVGFCGGDGFLRDGDFAGEDASGTGERTVIIGLELR